MADTRMRKRPRKIREGAVPEKPTKEETAVAKYLRFHLPTKETTFMQENVQYFTGQKAVDFLLESKWAKGTKGTDVLFTTRLTVVNYLNRLLKKRMFYRAIKTVKRKREKDAKSKDKEGKEKEKESKSKDKELKKKEKEKDSKMKDKETIKKESETEEKKSKKEKKKEEQEKEEEEENEANEKETKKGKKKIVLDFADHQCFKDNLDAYVWVYDPVKTKDYILGFTLVIAAIGVCIYPLWPPEIKIGTYYVSLVGAGFVGFILGLAIFRFILFTCLWVATVGKLHFWLFPNLLEDVGVRESFQPFYAKEWRSGEKQDMENDSDKENKKDDDDDNKKEDGDEMQEENEEKSNDSKNEESVKSESSDDSKGSEMEEEECEAQDDFEVIGKEEISAVEE
ncbi:translocation protein SEC62-like [Anneissia japonica]|uniref:translocation protein SEC62-like n=1 Tax=Anneissia japonica TaxID=1529436 RepID=UPI0014259E77|nr:translocation protein SEC62-like [Anneissia japonica]